MASSFHSFHRVVAGPQCPICHIADWRRQEGQSWGVQNAMFGEAGNATSHKTSRTLTERRIELNEDKGNFILSNEQDPIL
jgi:hypothetical protein